MTQSDPLAIASTRPGDAHPAAGGGAQGQPPRATERRVSALDHTHAHTYEYGDLERVMNSALGAEELGESM